MRLGEVVLSLTQFKLFQSNFMSQLSFRVNKCRNNQYISLKYDRDTKMIIVVFLITQINKI